MMLCRFARVHPVRPSGGARELGATGEIANGVAAVTTFSPCRSGSGAEGVGTCGPSWRHACREAGQPPSGVAPKREARVAPAAPLCFLSRFGELRRGPGFGLRRGLHAAP